VRQNAFSVRQDGSSASTSYHAIPTTKKHMDNDALIIDVIAISSVYYSRDIGVESLALFC
jgi:hypothetical protein